MFNKLKVCVVCKERAKGNNFGVITCQSCKAFFRRNANKSINVFNCEYEDNCDISIANRKTCKKCRLKKCFAVGMKKEWILNEDERQLRRKQIEDNRHKREKLMRDKEIKSMSLSVSPSLRESSDSGTAEDFIMSSMDTTFIGDEELCEYIKEIDNFCSIDTFGENTDPNKELSETLPTDPVIAYPLNIGLTNAMFAEDITKNTPQSQDNEQEITQKINDTNGGKLSQESALKLQLVSTQPSTQSLSANSHYLNKHESNCLLELLGAISHLTTPPIPSSNAVNGFFRSPEELMNYSVEVFDSYLSDFVDSIKKISAFQHICLNDQIALVKYGCLEVKMIRIGVSFDIKNKCWSFQTDNNDTIKLSLDLFKGFKTNTYSVLKKYLLRVVNELDHDHLILNLLVPILFFNPERPNIIHKEVVVLQQQLYVYLLQRYLRLKYGSESDVRNKFLRILNLMQDVQALDKLHKQNMITTVSPNNFGPLLKEILDIQTDLCIDN